MNEQIKEIAVDLVNQAKIYDKTRIMIALSKLLRILAARL